LGAITHQQFDVRFVTLSGLDAVSGFNFIVTGPR
jgi:hypothetical protein